MKVLVFDSYITYDDETSETLDQIVARFDVSTPNWTVLTTLVNFRVD